MTLKLKVLRSLLPFAVLLSVAAFAGAADAASVEQIKATCHDKFVPVVRECVHRKVAESGGSPQKYIPGCRAAIMAEARDCVVKLMKAASAAELAATVGDTEIESAPPSGPGRVVIVISGSEGPDPLKDYAQKIAQLGYDTFVIDGRAILSADLHGGERLQQLIAKAQSSHNALPGKVAVIGFALGGGGALLYAERQSDAVATVIAYYPATVFIAKVGGMKSFVGKFQVPLLAFAAGQDTAKDCCLLATIKDMQATAKDLGKPMELVVYPNADHNFSAGPNYRADDAADAWRRTTDVLHQYLTATAVH